MASPSVGPPRLQINALDYGTRDGAAINRAIVDAYNLGGGTVRVPQVPGGWALVRSTPGVQMSGGIVPLPGVTVLGENTTLTLADNTSFVQIASTLGAAATVTADTAATDITLTVDSSAAFSVGQAVQVKLGDAAYDAGEPDWWMFATIAAIPDGTHVTLDRPVCYAMTVGSTTAAHRVVIPITRLAEDIRVEGFDLVNSMGVGVNAEMGIGLVVARNITLHRITGLHPGSGLVNGQYVEHMTIGQVEVRRSSMQNGQASKGRGLSLAECRNVSVDNANLRDCEGAFVVLEAGCDAVSFGTLRIDNGHTGRTQPLIVHLGRSHGRYDDIWGTGLAASLYENGGTTGCTFDAGSVALDMAGTVPATHVETAITSYRAGATRVAGPVLHSPNGTRYRLAVSNAGTLTAVAE